MLSTGTRISALNKNAARMDGVFWVTVPKSFLAPCLLHDYNLSLSSHY